jgi:adenylate cyclase
VDAIAPRVGGHFERGGVPERAVDYFELAASSAERRVAYREGAAYLSAALAQVEAARDGGSARSERAGILHLRLGNLLTLAAGYSIPEVQREFVRAREILEAHGSVPGVFIADMGLGLYELTRARYREARAHTDHLIALSRDGVPGFAAIALAWAAFGASAIGAFAVARRLLEDGLRSTPPDRGVMRFHDTHRLIRSQLALVLTVTGDIEAGRIESAAALAHSVSDGRPSDLAHAWILEAERALWLHDRTRGRAAAAAGLALATENGLASMQAFGTYDALLASDRADQARLAVMREALAERRRLGDRWHESMLLGLLAEAELGAGEVDAAQASLEAALTHVARTGERHYEAELHRLRAACALATRRANSTRVAAGCLRRAMAVAGRQGARLWGLRAATALARLTPDGAPGRRAAAHLSQVLATFAPDVEFPDVTAARESLAARGSA